MFEKKVWDLKNLKHVQCGKGVVQGLGKVHTVVSGKVPTVTSFDFSRPVGSGVDGDCTGAEGDSQVVLGWQGSTSRLHMPCRVRSRGCLVGNATRLGFS